MHTPAKFGSDENARNKSSDGSYNTKWPWIIIFERDGSFSCHQYHCTASTFIDPRGVRKEAFRAYYFGFRPDFQKDPPKSFQECRKKMCEAPRNYDSIFEFLLRRSGECIWSSDFLCFVWIASSPVFILSMFALIEAQLLRRTTITLPYIVCLYLLHDMQLCLAHPHSFHWDGSFVFECQNVFAKHFEAGFCCGCVFMHVLEWRMGFWCSFASFIIANVGRTRVALVQLRNEHMRCVCVFFSCVCICVCFQLDCVCSAAPRN